MQGDTIQESRARLCELCEQGALWDTVDAYLAECRSEGAIGVSETAKKAKRMSRFPNLAGLCRYALTGTSDLSALKTEHPSEYDRLLAIFEDEALNAELSPTLLSAYVKRRITGADEGEMRQTESEVRYCFEHDIFADGE